MSWSISIPETPGRDFEGAVDNAVDAWKAANPDAATVETMDQIGPAAEAAKAIGLSGGLGSDYTLKGYLSGHANTDHTPREGASNDTITVNVAQVRALQPA